MREQTIHAADGRSIPIRVGAHGTTTLLECREAIEFLSLLRGERVAEGLRSDAFVRGIYVPGEGAVFDVRDPLGLVAEEVVRLTEPEARRILAGVLETWGAGP